MPEPFGISKFLRAKKIKKQKGKKMERDKLRKLWFKIDLACGVATISFMIIMVFIGIYLS